MRERWKWILVVGVFVAAWFLPADRLSPGDSRLQGALVEALSMLHEYARDHVLLCLVPAFFIAGGISVFVRQASVAVTLSPATDSLMQMPPLP